MFALRKNHSRDDTSSQSHSHTQKNSHTEAVWRAPLVVRTFAGHHLHTQQLSTPLKIAHLTDLHIGRVTPLAVHLQAVAQTNAINPDAVMLTGDFVCHSLAYLDELTAVISGFTAPVICVLGNHDHWSGAVEVRRALKKGGAIILDNANTTLTLRGQKLQIAGIDDSYTKHADLAQATRGLDPHIATVGLSHIGEEADAMWQAGIPLVLAGHTHAGQITWARLHELALGKLVGHRYIHGLYGARSDESWRKTPRQGALYVGAGVGAAVMPLRLGARAQREIAVFELGLQPHEINESLDEQPPFRKEKSQKVEG